ncbi:tail fiber protein [Avibacterium paragallinarum]|uniref:Phage tail fibre repeat n=1 Tax=Avibacterium paragallinarum TaxID=728 RepID=A0A380X6K3_AVIPA|nr:tail fiber protein [Avibacterium paragallinarum]SUU97876.1 Phage tail fibre repeat [Avibacterium paragallinarum]SUU98454.1 Phage tail fibre repeat [Avibacterium paragallinarum]
MKLLDLFKTIVWAKNGDTTDFSQTNYEAGWAHLGDDTPTVQDFNYVQQMNDKKDQWLFKQLKAVMENAGIEPTEDNINALLNAILKIAKGHSTPKAINAETVDFVDETGHTHSISKASLAQAGIVQLTNATNSEAETLGLTAKAGKTLKGLIDALTRNLSNYIPNSKKSNAINSASSDTVATSNAVKTAYDKAVEADNHAERAYHLAESKQSPATTLAGYGIGDFKVGTSTGDDNDCKIDGNYYFASGQNLPSAGEWHIEVISGGQNNAIRQIARKANDTKVKTRYFNGASWSDWKDVGGDGVPVGSVVAFPSAVQNPHGFLRCDGSTFGRTTYPALYQALGVNTLPDLRRSDVGMTAYFATDNIPEGWIAFDDIEEQVSEQAYPELYRHLVAKYGSLSAVPKAKDRFIRNAGALLAVGEVQEDALQDHFHYIPTQAGGDSQTEKDITVVIHNNHTTNAVPGAFKPAEKGKVQANNATITDGVRVKTYLASTKDGTNKDTRTSKETRPKSLVLKLCIKAQNTLDGVQFWIKAFGEIANAGQLDASRLAQDIQEVKAKKADVLHTHRVSEITDFERSVEQYLNNLFSQQFTENGWSKLPNGLIIQWGKFRAGWEATTQRRVTFPITFPNQVFFIGLTEFTKMWSYTSTVQSRGQMDNSGFEVVSQRNDTMFLAIGY